MGRRLPLIALWGSLAYLLAALAVTSRLCFVQLRAFGRGATDGTGSVMNPAWVILTADTALDRLWWHCSATGLGVLLMSLSVLWVTLSPPGPVDGPREPADPTRLSGS